MNIAVSPGVVVQPGDTLTADLLNQGFNPSVQAIGLVEAADIANGAVHATHLNSNLMAPLDSVTPGDADHVLIQKSGILGKATIQEILQNASGKTTIERTMLSVPVTQTATTDEVMIYRPEAAEDQKILRAGIGDLAPDLITPGTYRAGSITVDSKGRVTAINETGGAVISAQLSLPNPGSSISWAHGLGQTPTFVQAWLHRIAPPGQNELYNIGDRVDITTAYVMHHRAAFSIITNDTQVIITRWYHPGYPPYVLQQNGVDLLLNYAHWRIVICARL